ncbi:MAG: tripartite tricarboxylate transporter permease [Planctomycetales bacterium]|nr:tripartite tricarboxylate transporter permease [Planctomycetales bacterium]
MRPYFYEALSATCEPRVLLVVVLSAAYGILIGSIPGLTATMAVALLVPMTFFLDSVSAIAAIVTTVTCSIFAGDIPAALVRIPGTPASAAYASDAYALTRRGRAEQALGTSLVFSVIGGLFGILVLMVAAPQLARVATRFTSYEYFWLYAMGLTCAAIVSDQSRLKGLLALLIGLILSTVGLGTDYSTPRLTFGWDQLITGVSFIPAMIGLFGVSEVLRNALVLDREADARLDGGRATREDGTPDDASGRGWLAATLAGVLPLAWRRKWSLLRSSVIGSLIGMLPGAGADIAAWISYAVSKRFSREPQRYGSGSLEGLGDATGSNNAAIGSAWIPALVFGIPGDSVTAIAIGVLLMKNITPGPNIFDADSPDNQLTLVFSLYIVFALANLVLLPLGLLAIRGGTLLIRIPRRVLLPLVLMFCIVGSYALNASYFDVGVMLTLGLLGFVLERFAVPLGPVVLGIILGGELEHKFIQCLTKSDSFAEFGESLISKLLILAIAALWLGPLAMRLARKSPFAPRK